MVHAKRIDIALEEVISILAEVKAKLGEPAFEKLSALFDAYRYVLDLLGQQSTTLRRLRRIVFGPHSEKTKDVCGQHENTGSGEERDGGKKTTGGNHVNDPPDDGGTQTGENGAGANTANNPPDDGGAQKGDISDAKAQEKEKNTTNKPKPKGHGRIPAAAYHGATTIDVPHPTLKVGSGCPLQCDGRLYGLLPAVIVRFVGGPPLRCRVYKLERLRCSSCGAVFTAPKPPEVGPQKYDETAGAMLAMLRYGTGMPMYRLAGLQGSLGAPLPPGTQWQILEANVPKIYPVIFELIGLAACGTLLHNDDTTMRILELLARRKQGSAEGKTKKVERKGVFTSGIVAFNASHKIVLFFTGNKHAGERLQEVMQRRDSALGPPIQMADALPHNVPKDFATILANCLAHARRRFIDVEAAFPAEVRYVLEQIREVYRNDEIARTQGMTDEQRLRFHQLLSGPILGRLRRWMRRKLQNKEIEPNSELGGAFAYVFKHWRKLTLFLRVAGAPLDNSIVERALKKAIIHRKNSLFYKTENGAWVGDIYMSLIHTAELAGADPLDYLTKLLVNWEHVAREPTKWLPWNYRETEAALRQHEAA